MAAFYDFFMKFLDRLAGAAVLGTAVACSSANVQTKHPKVSHASAEPKQRPLSSFSSVPELNAEIKAVRGRILKKFGARGVNMADAKCQRDYSEMVCALQDAERKLKVLDALSTAFEKCSRDVPAEDQSVQPDTEKHVTVDLDCFLGGGTSKAEEGLESTMNSLPTNDILLDCQRQILACYRGWSG
jgi:hypothetical protein